MKKIFLVKFFIKKFYFEKNNKINFHKNLIKIISI